MIMTMLVTSVQATSSSPSITKMMMMMMMVIKFILIRITTTSSSSSFCNNPNTFPSGRSRLHPGEVVYCLKYY